jgi:hypothetical protein
MTIDYLLGAKQGQSMNVSMATDNGEVYEVPLSAIEGG